MARQALWSCVLPHTFQSIPSGTLGLVKFGTRREFPPVKSLTTVEKGSGSKFHSQICSNSWPVATWKACGNCGSRNGFTSKCLCHALLIAIPIHVSNASTASSYLSGLGSRGFQTSRLVILPNRAQLSLQHRFLHSFSLFVSCLLSALITPFALMISDSHRRPTLSLSPLQSYSSAGFLVLIGTQHCPSRSAL